LTIGEVAPPTIPSWRKTMSRQSSTKRSTWLGRILTTLAVVLGTIVVPVADASAASCGGSLVGRYPLAYGGSTIGELAVYYNGSTGQNCARMNHLGPTYGVTLRTVVFIMACRETSPSSVCT
ncbi:MAG: hypothetical protein M3443_08965, partial [Actinomycetota bacterium]|nr:hypothetical protein [Actinomycetota bacterium]